LLGVHDVCAGFMIGIAGTLRVTLIALGWPHLNSDEGTMGLISLHIARNGQHPAFFYGQSYMGALEAYLGAVFFRLHGASEFALRLGLVLLFVLFLVSTYLLVSQLYSKNLALVSLALLSLGSERMLFRQLQAIGGYVETLLFGSIVFLLSSWLALSYRSNVAARRGRRLAAYVAWGLAAGLGLWSDVLILPMVAVAALLLALFCWRELRWTAGLLLLLGALIGASPVIFYSASVPRGENAFTALLTVYRANSSGQTGAEATVGESIAGTVMVSLPIMTGGNIVCPVGAQDAWPLNVHTNPHAVRCATVHGLWGAGAIALWSLAVFFAVRSIWMLRLRTAGRSWAAAERREAVRQCARLALLASAALTLILYMFSPAAAQSPWFSARYLTPLWVALPAVIAPCVMRMSAVSNRALWQWPGFGLVGTLFLALLLGTVDAFKTTSYVQWVNERQYALAADLERRHTVRIYSDYWTCDRIVFQSRERVICSAVNDHLGAGLDRYLSYRLMVERSSDPAYVFPVASPQSTAFARRVSRSPQRYRLFSVDGYVVYIPSRRSAGGSRSISSRHSSQEASGRRR
jgi:hypothetical protein